MKKLFYYIFTVCAAFQLSFHVIATDELGLDPETEAVDTIEQNQQTEQHKVKRHNKKGDIKKAKKHAKRKRNKSHKQKKRHQTKKKRK